MDVSVKGFAEKPSVRRWGLFFAKSYGLLVLVFAFSMVSPVLPPVCIGLVWAILSAASAIALVYHAVVRKSHRQLMLSDGGWLSKLNSGRLFSLVAAFVVSAVCMAGLILEAPKWDVLEWLPIALAPLLYLGVSLAVSKFMGGEYGPAFRASKTTIWSCAIVGVLLCVVYVVVVACQPPVTYATASDAFLAAKRPFDGSPSALMSQTGIVTAFLDGITAFGFSKASEVSFGGYLGWRIALYASTFLGVANLVGACSLEWSELRKAFMPLQKDDAEDGSRGFVKRYVAVAAVLPLCLTALFLAADLKVAEAAGSQEGTAIESFVRDQAGIAVYVLDGHYYDQQAVQDLMAQAQRESEQLLAEAEETLVPLINESFDARIANVDSYLDWYYSLPADYERLFNMVTGSVEEYMEDQFKAHIEEGIDDSLLTAELEDYYERAAALKDGLLAQLADYEVTDVPEWLLVTDGSLGADFLTEPMAPTQRFLQEGERIGISVGLGAAAGVVAAKLVKRALTKQFFSKMVAKVATFLGSRGVTSAGGAAVGTAAGPVGTAVGFVVGTIVGFGADFGMLKLDEWQNRESYRAEMVEVIEEERAEMLALVQGA